ncbi:MAG: gliding motility-associated C-terminal domain-containing protein [Cytophagaceae bacterium]
MYENLLFDKTKENDGYFNTNDTYFTLIKSNIKTIGSNINVTNSICDSLGETVLYYDGFSLYNSSKEIIQYGHLNEYVFAGSYQQSLFIPVEETNRRLYYFLEAIPYQENWDFSTDQPKSSFLNSNALNIIMKYYDVCQLKMHVVDTWANSGRGAVIKSSVLLDSVVPALSAVKHADNIKTWVSIMKYKENKQVNFLFGLCGIEDTVINQLPYFYIHHDQDRYLSYSPFSGTGFQLVYSPNGEKVAYPYVELTNDPDVYFFYSVICDFNASTGSINNSTAFRITHESPMTNNSLFSYNGEYYYFNEWDFTPDYGPTFQLDLSNNIIKRFVDKYILNENLYAYLLYGTMDYVGDTSIYFPMYYAPASTNLFMTKINHIDQSFQSTYFDTIVTNSIRTVPYDYDYYILGRNNHIYNFYHPDYKKPKGFVTPVANTHNMNTTYCFLDSIYFSGNSSFYTDSTRFVVVNNQNTSSYLINNNTKAKLPSGSYQLKYVSYYYCFSDTITTTLIIDSLPVSPLVLDTILTCENKSIEVAPVNNSTYQWTSYSAALVSPPFQSGDYILNTTNACGVIADTLSVINATIFASNLVTSNKDGKNDCLEIDFTGLAVPFFLEVYNSWGDRVFSSNNYAEKWCPSSSVESGVYYYKVYYLDKCTYNSWVHVVK